MPHPYAFLCGVTQIAQMTQISFTFLPLKFPRRWSHPAKYDEGKKRAVPRRNEARSKLSPGAMKSEASCPQAVPSRKIWRGL